ncbi:beta-glucosidase [Malassezia sp. CBS 17886]|nr:beta-glucosidase [Malassezia sp. CBS 17886]
MDAGPGTGHAGRLPPRAGIEPAAKRAKVITAVDTPYFTPAQVDRLSTRARANKMSAAKWDQVRLGSCSFIAAVGAKLGWCVWRSSRLTNSPQRTIGTAQMLYQRFHMLYSPADFAAHEVALASLFTSAKLNDTQKKAHEFLMASYALRYPELVQRGDAAHDADWMAHAYVREGEIDDERMLRWVIKVARQWQLSKAHTAFAWRIACDSFRTSAPMTYMPHTVAVGSVCAALALLQVWPLTRLADHGAVEACTRRIFGRTETIPWEQALETSLDDVHDVAQQLLTLYTNHVAGVPMPKIGDTRRDTDDAAPRTEKRAVPSYVSHPPPIGLLWLRDIVLDATRAPDAASERVAEGLVTKTGCVDLHALLTQAQIVLRTQERRGAEQDSPRSQERRRAASAARMSDDLPPTLYSGDAPGQAAVTTRYLF